MFYEASTLFTAFDDIDDWTKIVEGLQILEEQQVDGLKQGIEEYLLTIRNPWTIAK